MRIVVWNCNGGLIASKTDQNGQTTSFSYDLMNRRTQMNLPDGGWKLIEHYEDGRAELFDLQKDPGVFRR